MSETFIKCGSQPCKSPNRSSDICSKCYRKQLEKQDSQKEETSREGEGFFTIP